MPQTPDPITRERVIDAFRRLPEGVGITTLGLAWLIGCIEEHRIRAAVSWLALGGLIEEAGKHQRKDRRGRAYSCRLYAWRGRDEIRRVPHDHRARRFAHEQEMQADTASLAMAWLSRRPPSLTRDQG